MDGGMVSTKQETEKGKIANDSYYKCLSYSTQIFNEVKNKNVGSLKFYFTHIVNEVKKKNVGSLKPTNNRFDLNKQD